MTDSCFDNRAPGRPGVSYDEASVIRTERLFLRELRDDDYPSLSAILQDEDVMYAYGGAFSEEETEAWLERQMLRYRQYGFGLWGLVRKTDGEMVGQCGLTMQRWKNEEVLEVGYLLRHADWHKGYATEAVRGCISYAYDVIGASEVSAIIRDSNTASIRVAQRCGMEKRDSWVKHYRGYDMPHCRFSCIRERKTLR